MYVVEKQGIALLEKNIISSCVVASFHLRPINPEDIKIWIELLFFSFYNSHIMRSIAGIMSNVCKTSILTNGN